MLKRRSTFNIIDALIIILIVAAIVGAYFFFQKGSAATSEGTDVGRIRYVLQLSELPTEYSDNIKVGEAVFDHGTGESVGTVVAVDFKNSVYVGYDRTTGEPKLTTLDEYIDLYVTVEGDAQFKSNIYRINETDMYIGKTLEMMMPELYAVGNCISLDVIGAE